MCKGMRMEKVSIIIPAYNCENTIERCLNSLISQKYKNIEMIVVNDGSTDDTRKKIESYNDDRIKLFNQENKGVSAARNLGLKKATGKFVAFCDADDFYSKYFLIELIPLFDEETVMVACDWTSKKKEKRIKNKTKIFTLKDGIKELFADKYLFVYMCNKIFRRKYLKNISFNEKIKNFGEDLLFSLAYLKQFDKGQIVYSYNKLYHYIHNKGSLSSLRRSVSFPKYKLDFLKVLDLLAKDCKEQDLCQRINSWQFLILTQYLYETRKNKTLHDKLKEKAKGFYKDYKKNRNAYKSFRKFGFIYRLL